MAFHSKNRFESWLPALFDGEFAWDFLDPAWKGTKIKPMDFDAVIERRKHFLVFETKIPGKDIEKGQRITLTELWRTGFFTIIVLSGKKPEEINGMAIYAEGKSDGSEVGSKKLEICNAYDVIFRVRCWFCWASGDPIPTRDEWDNELFLWDYDRAWEVNDSARG